MIDNDLFARKRLTRRLFVVGGIQLAAVGAIGARLKVLQMDEARKYQTLAEENRVSMQLTRPVRGLIYDIQGRRVADNTPNFRLNIIPERCPDPEEVVNKLARLVAMPDWKIREILEQIENAQTAFNPLPVLEHLPWNSFAQVSENIPVLPGVETEIALSRRYEYSQLFAHTVGYVGPVSTFDKANMDTVDPVYNLPKMPIGKTGLENKLEPILRGEPGFQRLEVNIHNRVMREIDSQVGDPGDSVQITLDAEFQNFAMTRLQRERSASAVVVDTVTGDIRLLASAPSFDPNKFIFGISHKDWDALRNNEYRPMSHKAVSGAYPPGSTFKMVTALAALEAGVIDPGEGVYCPGYVVKGGRRFHCWRRGGHGWVNLNESLKKSCDCYYYEVAERVGIDKIADMARRLGLGDAFDLPLQAQTQGFIPTVAWKNRTKNEPWTIGDTLNASIGQGFVLTSPLQLAVMTARLASGMAVEPRIVRSINAVQQKSEFAPLDINPNHLRWIRQGMFSVANEQGGTAYSTRINTDPQRMSGKTGTSQVRIITAAERAAGVIRNDQLPWNRRDHGLYVGFAPYNNPRYAVSVVVEHGSGGSTAAAPIARDMMLYIQNNGLPPLEAYPWGAREAAESFFNSVPPLDSHAPRTPTFDPNAPSPDADTA